MSRDCCQVQEIAIPSKDELVAQARDHVARIAGDCGFSADVVFDIKVAVGEAVANAVEHGSPCGEAGLVKVSCLCEQGSFVIRVIDEGVFKCKMVAADSDCDFRGHGLMLMLALMDQVTVDESATGTTVILIKRFSDDRAETAKTAGAPLALKRFARFKMGEG